MGSQELRAEEKDWRWKGRESVGTGEMVAAQHEVWDRIAFSRDYSAL